MGVTFFNKIINIDFLRDGKPVVSIVCPKLGRKPSIEITGQYTAHSCLETMNIRVKNLYLETIGTDFPAVRVTAGYEGATTEFEGQIFSMYQESPGPESSTVIQVTYGDLDKFLNKTISGSVKAGGSLSDALALIQTALGTNESKIDPTAAKMKTETKLFLDGTAREALQNIKKAFPEACVSVSRNQIIAISLKEPPSGPAAADIPFMSAPVQLTGGKDNAVSAVVTAPWNPRIRCNEIVSFPAKYYGGKSGVKSADSRQKMVPSSVQFQFSTTGTANKMVLTGPILQEKNTTGAS